MIAISRLSAAAADAEGPGLARLARIGIHDTVHITIYITIHIVAWSFLLEKLVYSGYLLLLYSP